MAAPLLRYFWYNFLLYSLHYKSWPIQNRFVVRLYPL